VTATEKNVKGGEETRPGEHHQFPGLRPGEEEAKLG